MNKEYLLISINHSDHLSISFANVIIESLWPHYYAKLTKLSRYNVDYSVGNEVALYY